METTLHKQIIDGPIESIWLNLWKLAEQVSEWFWFLFSFSLFVVLGPFSAPIALIALFKFGLEDHDHQEPDSVS